MLGGERGEKEARIINRVLLAKGGEGEGGKGQSVIADRERGVLLVEEGKEKGKEKVERQRLLRGKGEGAKSSLTGRVTRTGKGGKRGREHDDSSVVGAFNGEGEGEGMCGDARRRTKQGEKKREGRLLLGFPRQARKKGRGGDVTRAAPSEEKKSPTYVRREEGSLFWGEKEGFALPVAHKSQNDRYRRPAEEGGGREKRDRQVQKGGGRSGACANKKKEGADRLEK